jgi:YggT family protein
VISILIFVIDLITRLFILLLFVHIALTYFMSPFHPIRQQIDRIIEPLLMPIRRVIPTIGMFDFSPLVLILLVQILNLLIKNILYSFI